MSQMGQYDKIEQKAMELELITDRAEDALLIAGFESRIRKFLKYV